MTFKPGTKVGKGTRFKPGMNPKRQRKPSLLKQLEKYADKEKEVELPNGAMVKMTFIEIAAMKYWEKCMEGDIRHNKLLMNYFDGKPPEAPDPSLLRTPEDNARLIMNIVKDMHARNNGTNPDVIGSADGEVVSSSETSGSSRISAQLDAIQRGAGGAEILQDGDSEEAPDSEGDS